MGGEEHVGNVTDVLMWHGDLQFTVFILMLAYIHLSIYFVCVKYYIKEEKGKNEISYSWLAAYDPVGGMGWEIERKLAYYRKVFKKEEVIHIRESR